MATEPKLSVRGLLADVIQSISNQLPGVRVFVCLQDEDDKRTHVYFGDKKYMLHPIPAEERDPDAHPLPHDQTCCAVPAWLGAKLQGPRPPDLPSAMGQQTGESQ